MPSTWLRAVPISILFHISATFSYALIYAYLYGYGGDSYEYFKMARQALIHLLYHPESIPTWLASLIAPWSGSHLISPQIAPDNTPTGVLYTSLITVAPVALGLGYYLPASLWITTWTFLAQWRWALTFARLYHITHQTPPLPFWILILYPSSSFWMAVPQKEAYLFIGMTWFLLSLHDWLVLNQKHPIALVQLGMGALFMWYIRKWYFFALLIIPVLMVTTQWARALAQHARRTPWLLYTILLLGGLLGFATIGYLAFQEFLTVLLAQMERILFDMRFWHFYLATQHGHFGYVIPELALKTHLTWKDWLNAAPNGAIIALFRPFPWESQEIQHFLASLEGLLNLFLVASALIYGIQSPYAWQRVFRPTLALGIAFTALTIVTLSGTVTYNFGALSRYKCPFALFIPFFLALVIFFRRLHPVHSPDPPYFSLRLPQRATSAPTR